MVDLKIKTESRAKRCEICHQTDMFEQNTELCLRCKNIETLQNVKKGESLEKDVRQIKQIQIAILSGLTVDFLLLVFAAIMEFDRKSTSFVFPVLMLGGIVGSYIYHKRVPLASALERIKMASLIGLCMGTWNGLLIVFLLLSFFVRYIISESGHNDNNSFTVIKLASYWILPKVIGSLIGAFIGHKKC